jgi:hypothetical protein
MKTAFQMAQKWGMVPSYQVRVLTGESTVESPVTPEADRIRAREKAQDHFRDALNNMTREYRKRVQGMRRPLAPGPKPAPYEEMEPPPSFPEATASAETLEKYRRTNDRWVDEVFFPNEAERVIWEVANDLYQAWLLDRRAALADRMDTLRPWLWGALVAMGSIGVAVVAWGVFTR